MPSAFDLFTRLSKRERFSLGEDVGYKHVVVPVERIQASHKSNKVTRDQPRSLMDELIEGMLAVGARFTPIEGLVS